MTTRVVREGEVHVRSKPTKDSFRTGPVSKENIAGKQTMAVDRTAAVRQPLGNLSNKKVCEKSGHKTSTMPTKPPAKKSSAVKEDDALPDIEYMPVTHSKDDDKKFEEPSYFKHIGDLISTRLLHQLPSSRTVDGLNFEPSVRPAGFFCQSDIWDIDIEDFTTDIDAELGFDIDTDIPDDN